MAGSAALSRPATTLATGPILLFGVERSGTSWLGKIFDSHPATLYRHEPERVLEDFGLPWICPERPTDVVRAAAADYLRRMIATATVATAGPAPRFPKAWRPLPRTALHRGLTEGVRLLARFDPRRGGLHNLTLPDLAGGAAPRMVVKSISGHGRAALLAGADPAARVVVLLRDPGGQIDSVLRGTARGKFVEPTDLDWIPPTSPARRHGLTAAALEQMDRIEQLAWQWVVRNEMLLDDLGGAANAMVLRYDDLCADPEAEARRLFAFAGLPWHPQTEAFLAASTSGAGAQGYYSVFRDPAASLNRWRGRLDAAAQRRIGAILRRSKLARWWPDFP